MNSFTFHNPTHFIFGKAAEEQAGEALKALGASRVLIVTGQGSAERSGLLSRVEQSVSGAGLVSFTLKGAKPNPYDDLVREGIALARNENIDFLMGVGGASALDTAKAIALGAVYEGDFWDFYCGKRKPESCLPLAAVITIAAAGSESSNSSVITNRALNLKRGVRSELIRPRLALLNPELTFTLPPIQKAYGAADIMAHIFERYFTNTRDVALTDELCEGVLRTVIAAAPRALLDSRDYAAHADLLWAGTLAHNDTLSTGREQDWGAHAMAHGLSARFNIPHGGALAVLFPNWMLAQLPHDPARFERFARVVMGKTSAVEGIRALRAFYDSLGLPPTLTAYGVKKEDIPGLLEIMPYNNNGKAGFFNPLDAEGVKRVYEMSL